MKNVKDESLMTIDIVLIRPPMELPTHFAPLGVGYLGASLENAGYSVTILDMTAESMNFSDLARALIKIKPSIIGISCMITEYRAAVMVARTSKKYLPDALIVVGGPLPTSNPDLFLKKKCFDIIALGEGEKIIVEVAQRFEKSESFNGVLGTRFRTGNQLVCNPSRPVQKDLDTLPFPARHLFRMDRFISPFENWFAEGPNLKATNMISSRGCPYRCIYCDKAATGTIWRGRSAMNLVEEIEYLSDRFNVNGIIFSDDMFDFNKKRVYELCDELDNRGLDISWGINSRVNHVDLEFYKRIQKSGCRYVAFGIEFGDQDILNFIERKTTVKQARKAVKVAKIAGLRTVGYFMIGMLGENREKILKTIEFAKSLDLDSGGFSRVTPLPGTQLYKLARQRGYIKNDKYATSTVFGGDINLTDDLSSEEIDEYVEKAYWEFFWSRSSRLLPYSICNLISMLFPIIYKIIRGNTGIFVHIDELRRLLRLPQL